MTFKVRLEELLEADIRICDRYQARTPKAREKAWLRWLLAFSERTPFHLSQGDWLNLRHEVGALTLAVSTKSVKSAEEIEEKIKRLVESKRAISILPSEEEVLELQDKIQRALKELLSPLGTTILGPFRVKVWVSRGDRTQIAPVRKSYIDQLVEGSVTDRTMHQIAILLGKYGAMVERCPECERLFLADRKNQTYCSAKCQTRVTSRRYRQKQRKKSEMGPRRRKRRIKK